MIFVNVWPTLIEIYGNFQFSQASSRSLAAIIFCSVEEENIFQHYLTLMTLSRYFVIWILPLASLRTRLSISRSSRAVDSRTPSAPVTNRRARAAHVLGRSRYGCRKSELFLALAFDSAVALVSGFNLTNAWPEFNTCAAIQM